MQMRLWERMNLGAASYGQREMGNRYVPVRVEDFILPDEKTRADTIIHLFGRLGLNTVDEPGIAFVLEKRTICEHFLTIYILFIWHTN